VSSARTRCKWRDNYTERIHILGKTTGVS
jgi:hypothetical protein